MNVTIKPTRLSGVVEAVSSKSDGHRKIICAALSDKETEIIINNISDDIEATLDAIKNLGGDFTMTEKGILIKPICAKKDRVCLDFRESGSTARFLLPVASVLCENGEFTGSGRLPQRPFAELTSQMRKNGVEVSGDNLPLTTKGTLKNGVFELAGNVSSQYISGLLFALPLLCEKSIIRLTSPLMSAPYVDMTIDVLSKFGVRVEVLENQYNICPQKYVSPKRLEVEGDWSSAAFWIVADKICGNVKIEGMNTNSRQGDKTITEILDETEIDARDIPDLVPILAVLAASRTGKTRIFGAQRLRIKESDRLYAVTKCINDLGGTAEETDDGIIVTGTGRLKGGIVDSFNDHRIAMSCAIASVICENEVTILNGECVKKSYPAFFDDFGKLGGVYDVSDR